MEDVRDARVAQRHAELWLEKSLTEVDALHAILEHSDRTALGDAATGTCAAPTPTNTVDPSAQTPHPPSPDFARTRVNSGEERQQQTHVAVGPGAQTPRPPSPVVIRRVDAGLGSGGGPVAVGGGAAIGGGHYASPAGSQISPVLTPDLRDTTMPLLFSASKRLGCSAGTERDWKEGNDCALNDDIEGGKGRRGSRGSRTRFNSSSPPTPTVLFEDMGMERPGVSERGHGNGSMSSSHEKIYFSLNGAAHEKEANAILGAKVNGGGNTLYHGPAGPGASKNGHTPSELNGPPHAEANGKSGGTYNKAALLLLWHSFFLRYEISRREKAEARAAQLEVEFNHAAIEKAAASGDADPTDDQGEPLQAPRIGQATNSRLTSEDTASGMINDARQCKGCCCCACGGGGHHSLALPGATCTSISGATADCYAHFARLDQERQKRKILDLVREARSKMNMSGKEAGNGAGAGPGSWIKEAAINSGGGGGRRLPVEKGCVE